VNIKFKILLRGTKKTMSHILSVRIVIALLKSIFICDERSFNKPAGSDSAQQEKACSETTAVR
jgi:hypothetical protein